MDISETWKKLEKERLERPIKGDLQEGKYSRHPVAKLKRNYFIKTIMMLVFLVCLVGLFFLFDQPLIKYSLAILVVAYVIFLTSSLFMYKSIRSDLPVDGSLMNILTETKEQIERGLRFEKISSMLVYPFGGVAGYLMGYTVSGANINNIYNDAWQMGIFIGTIVVFTILGYFAGLRLTREGYGKSLDEIRGMIDQLRAN